MIVAFYSYAPESGKDTAGRAGLEWARMENRTAAKRGFADPLKVVCADALGFKGTDEEKVVFMDKLKFDGEVQALRTMDLSGLHGGKTSIQVTSTTQPGRDFIIGLAGDSSGEFGIRRFDMGFWTRLALTHKEEVLFITDLRFRVEAEAVRERGGKIVEIERPGTTHKNEDRLEPDYKVVNDDSLAGLEMEIFNVLDAIFPP